MAPGEASRAGSRAVGNGVGDDSVGLRRNERRPGLAEPSLARAAGPDAGHLASGRQAARSIWAVVPSAPRRKADLRPDLIQGSAVAVSADTLVANCLVVGGRARVGLVRHNKYRMARVTADAHGQVCRLTVAEGPLTPVAGLRSFADLRVGEPVVALASRSSAEVAAAPGWLAGKGSADDPFLEATPAVPAGNRSAVLVDGFGNLIGLGAAAPVAGGLVLAVPVGPAAAPSLANRDLGERTSWSQRLHPRRARSRGRRRSCSRWATTTATARIERRPPAAPKRPRTSGRRRRHRAPARWTDRPAAERTGRVSPTAADRRVRQRPVAVASMAAARWHRRRDSERGPRRRRRPSSRCRPRYRCGTGRRGRRRRRRVGGRRGGR